MHIEELKRGDQRKNGEDEKVCSDEEEGHGGSVAMTDVKRVLVGAGARALFYPTLLYNVVRNKFQEEFRWWDWVDEFLLLGAVPFPADVERLKELGVRGVITLNESYETLVPTSLYLAHGIDHLVLPTRDYLFAPSLIDMCQAVDFIKENASCGRSTYVHCKAGRGRSTTIVICYLVQHKQMTPEAAYNYVKSIRPRVLLAPSQWQAVQDYYHLKVTASCKLSQTMNVVLETPNLLRTRDLVAFDDGSVDVVTQEDLDGYDPTCDSIAIGTRIWSDLRLVCKIAVAGRATLARISCLWLRCQTQQKIPGAGEKLSNDRIASDQLGVLKVDIHVY